jgi:hypothetical protein
MRRRIWKQKWPLITETELQRTGTWILKPYLYYNHTLWPWTTGIEMLARSRFNKVEECYSLLSKLASEGHPHLHAFYEWINPITDKESGAYPFRTGITAISIAIVDILEKIKSGSSSTSSSMRKPKKRNKKLVLFHATMTFLAAVVITNISIHGGSSVLLF